MRLFLSKSNFPIGRITHQDVKQQFEKLGMTVVSEDDMQLGALITDELHRLFTMTERALIFITQNTPAHNIIEHAMAYQLTLSPSAIYTLPCVVNGAPLPKCVSCLSPLYFESSSDMDLIYQKVSDQLRGSVT